MSGYQYTYPDRSDEAGFDDLTTDQQRLGHRINAEARSFGSDRQDLLRRYEAPAADKVALAELWGGPGAGKEFQR